MHKICSQGDWLFVSLKSDFTTLKNCICYNHHISKFLWGRAGAIERTEVLAAISWWLWCTFARWPSSAASKVSTYKCHTQNRLAQGTESWHACRSWLKIQPYWKSCLRVCHFNNNQNYVIINLAGNHIECDCMHSDCIPFLLWPLGLMLVAPEGAMRQGFPWGAIFGRTSFLTCKTESADIYTAWIRSSFPR